MNPNINAENVLRDGVIKDGVATLEDVTFEILKKEDNSLFVTISDKNGKVMWYESGPMARQTLFTIGPFDSLQFKVEFIGA